MVAFCLGYYKRNRDEDIYRKREMLCGGKVSRFSRMAIQSWNFYAFYALHNMSSVATALFKYFKRVDSAPRNFSAGIRKCMPCAKLFHRGTFAVYGISFDFEISCWKLVSSIAVMLGAIFIRISWWVKWLLNFLIAF